MKQTYTQEEILDIFESALDQIETELVVNTILHPPLTEGDLAKMSKLEDWVDGLKKSHENAMINGQTAGKIWMLEYIKNQLSEK